MPWLDAEHESGAAEGGDARGATPPPFRSNLNCSASEVLRNQLGKFAGYHYITRAPAPIDKRMPPRELVADMGKAKRKGGLRARLLADNPVCIFCTARSETVEHMPPKIMFTRKHRPNGLEFASCGACNGGTKHADLVAACIGRAMMLDSDEPENEDLPAIFEGLQNNLPDVLLEMHPSADQVETARREVPGQMVLNVGGPLVAGYMRQFAIKLSFALYREISGRAVPEGGGVLARWFTNYEDRTGRIPRDIYQNLMPPRTLKQGKSIHDVEGPERIIDAPEV